MQAPTKINFKMYQGSTFSEVLRWESSTKAYVPITNISQSAPCTVTAIAHSIPDGWRVKVTNVVGMADINLSDTYNTVSTVDVNTIKLNDINSVGYKAYVSGGILEYNIPVDLTAYTARMQLRASVDSVDIIDEYTTVNNKIIIDSANQAISIVVSATDTTAYTFTSAVYSLELTSPTGIVTQLITGNISLIKEITR